MMPLRATTPGALPGEGLYGLYFNNNDLSGSPMMRTHPPADRLRLGRRTRLLEAPMTGNFTLSTPRDDGVSLRTDNEKGEVARHKTQTRRKCRAIGGLRGGQRFVSRGGSFLASAEA